MLGVKVAVAVSVAVAVAVGVSVNVAVGVMLGVGVSVGMSVAVAVALGVGVSVGADKPVQPTTRVPTITNKIRRLTIMRVVIPRFIFIKTRYSMIRKFWRYRHQTG